MSKQLFKYTVAVGASSDSFRVPIEYKRILGIFFFATTAGQTISLYRDSKEVLPKYFDAEIIDFTGNLKREDVMFEVDFTNNNELWSINLTNATGIQIYFVVSDEVVVAQPLKPSTNVDDKRVIPVPQQPVKK